MQGWLARTRTIPVRPCTIVDGAISSSARNGKGVGEGVAVGVGVWVGVAVGVGVEVSVAVGEGVDVNVGRGVTLGNGVEVGAQACESVAQLASASAQNATTAAVAPHTQFTLPIRLHIIMLFS